MLGAGRLKEKHRAVKERAVWGRRGGLAWSQAGTQGTESSLKDGGALPMGLLQPHLTLPLNQHQGAIQVGFCSGLNNGVS